MLTSENFSDLFEAVLKRVTQTKNRAKHQRFRDILIDYIKHPATDIDNATIFLDLINDLDEIAVNILKHHRVFNKEYIAIQTERYQIEQSLPSLQESLNKDREIQARGHANDVELFEEQIKVARSRHRELKIEIDRMDKFRKAEYYMLSEDNFLFYKQVLLAKGLLADNNIGAIGGRPYAIMRITEFGDRFISFLLVEQ